MLLDEITRLIQNSTNKKEVLLKMGKNPRAGCYITLNKIIYEHDIDISHFKQKKCSNIKRTLDDILKVNTSYPSNKLKKRLFENGYLENKCSICGLEPYWNHKPLVHILDHINGNHYDNRIENLRIVCRHCDSQLDTFGSKNSSLAGTRHIECIKCNTRIIKNKTKLCYACYQSYRTENRKSKNNRRVYRKASKICKCGASITYNADSCISCENKSRIGKNRKVVRPPYNQLILEIKESNYCAVGRKYGVTDNAVRKWIKTYEKYENINDKK